jgi:long-chain fatty acid transport protein
MSYFDQKSLSVVGHYIAPSVDVEGTNSAPGTPIPSQNADASDIAPSAFVPGIFYVAPFDDQWTFGVAVTTHFGLSSEFPNGYAGSEHADEASIKSVYLTPSASYKVNDDFTIGLGISYIKGEGMLKSTSSNMSETRTGIPEGTPLLDLESDGDGFGWNVGLMWQIDETARLGFRYVAATDIDTDAKYTLASSPGADLKGTLTLNLPEVIELAYSRQLNEQWMIATSVQRTGWSSFESIKVKRNGTGEVDVNKEEDWNDVNRYALGADYKLNDTTVLRAGLALDESPVPDDKRSLSIPDTDRKILSVGGTFTLVKGSVDLGLSYLKGDTVDVNEETVFAPGVTTEFEGEISSADALIFSAGYNVSF